MRKLLTQTIFLVAFFVSAKTTEAQVYGQPFEVVDFANGIPAGWVNTSATGISHWEYRGPNTNPDINTGSRGSCINPNLIIESETRENGFVIFDSNYWDDPNGPCGGGFGSGQDPAPHTSSLTSTSFNFSDKNTVVINFQQRFRYHLVTTAAVQLSIAGGAFFTVHNNPTTTGAQSAAVEYVNINISQWAANQSDVRVRFFYQGIYYYWQIDDIVFYSPNNNDLLLETMQYTNFDFAAGETGLEDLEYDRYARIMVAPINFKAEVRNVGGLSQTGCKVQGVIKNQSNVTVYSIDSPTFTLAAGAVQNLSWGSFTPPSNPANQYTVTFTVVQNQVDEAPLNNVLTKDFETTDFRFAVAENNLDSYYEPQAQFLDTPFEIGCIYQSTSPIRRIASIGVVLSDSTQVGDLVYGILYNLNRDTILGITPAVPVNAYHLNAPGQEKIMYLYFPTPVHIPEGFYNVMVGGYGNGQKIRVGTNGTPPPFSCFLKYPGTPFTYYLTKTPMVYAHLVGMTAIPGCQNALAANFNPAATVNDGSCLFPGCIFPEASNYNPAANFYDNSCILAGCTNPQSPNYNQFATVDDGSCLVAGCTNPVATNYNPSATFDNGSCIIPGCTNPVADNFNSTATVDNGTCIISGCTDPAAANYNPSANQNNGSCLYPGCTNPVADNYDSGANTEDGSCIISGCTNPTAANFNPAANNDNGTCIFPGCTDPAAANYNPSANQNNGSCLYPGCTNPVADNYDSGANTDDGSCIISGCTDAGAANFNPSANNDNGTCIYPGCTDGEAANYDPQANEDDGSCLYPGCTNPAADNFDAGANLDDGSCIISGCTDSSAANFNPAANNENGTCIYPGCTDPAAANFDPQANEDDGSCLYPGCTDPEALNFDSGANLDDLSCLYPYANLATTLQSGCAPLTLTVINQTLQSGNGTCHFTMGDGTEVNDCANFTHTYTEPGEYFITYTYSVSDSVSDSIYGPITVFPVPTDVELSFNPANHQLACQNCSGLDLQWTLNGIPIITDETSFIASETGEYGLTATNEFGCSFSPQPVNAEVQSDALFNIDIDEGCVPLLVQISPLNSLNDNAECYYDLGNSIEVPGCESFNFEYTVPGVYFITYHYQVGEWNSEFTVGPISVYPLPANPALSFDPGTNVMSCSNCSGVTLHWTFEDVQLPETNSSFTALSTGTYSLYAENEFGCLSEVVELFAEVTNVNEQTIDKGWQLWPNPANETVNIRSNAGVYDLIVSDALGKRVLNLSSIASNVHSIDISDWSGGLYTIQLIGSQSNTVERIIVTK